jgi:hypothetical protein
LQPLASSRAVREVFRQILASSELRGAALMRSIEDAGRRQGVEPFGASLALFSRAARSEPDSRITFEEIEAHRDALRTRLQRDPGFAVAAADYLQLVEGLGWHRGEAPSGSGPAGRAGDRCFDRLLRVELRRHERHGRPLSLLLLSPWCPLEPEAMAAGAMAVTGAVRDIDQPARVLPEGIVVLLPCTEGEDGAAAARRLVALAESASHVAWCGGVAALPECAPDAEQFAVLVRGALEEALREGPGRVRLSRRERRRHPRRSAGALHGLVRSEGRALEVGVVDLSLHGALVQADADITGICETIVLEIAERTPRGRSARVAARVLRWSTATSADRPVWRAALAFDPGGSALPAVTQILAGLAADMLQESRR